MGACLITIIAIVVNAFLCKHANTMFDIGANYMTISEVEVSGTGSVSLPASIAMPRNQEITVSFTVPEGIREGDGFVYFSNYCVTEVKIEGKVISSFGQEMPLPWGHMLGNIRIIVPLNQDDVGKTVILHMTSPYTQNYAMDTIPIENCTLLQYKVLVWNLWRVIFLAFFTCALLIALAICVHHYARRLKDRARMYLCLACFIFCVDVWICCSSDLPQFITDQNAVISLISFLALTLMGPAFMGFCSLALPRGNRAFMIVGRLGLLLPVINIALYMTNLVDPPTLMYATHAYIVGADILVVVNCLRSFKTSKESRLLTLGMLAQMISVVVGLILFYFNTTDTRTTIVIASGLATFIFFTICMMLAKEDRMIGENAANSMYEELAFKDYLTGCGNRAAFERELNRCATNNAAKISLWMFDLNYLKKTNDELGHQAGDEIICGITTCIEEAFAHEGHCFRLGGDEFAAVIWDRKAEIEEYIEDLNQAIEHYNEEHVLQLSVAYGCAEGPNPGNRKGLNGLYSLADKNMYQNKMECHAKQGGEA